MNDPSGGWFEPKSHSSGTEQSHRHAAGARGPDPRIPAGFTLRLFALLADSAVMYLIMRLVGSVLAPGGLTFERFFGSTADQIYAVLGRTVIGEVFVPLIPLITIIFMWFIITYLIGLFYSSFCESSVFRATPGKLLMGIYVVDYEGFHCGLLRSFLRNILKFLSILPFAIGFLMAEFSFRKQALHDLLSNTLVVRKPDLDRQQTIVGAVAATLSFAILFLGVVIPSNIDFDLLLYWEAPSWEVARNLDEWERYSFFKNRPVRETKKRGKEEKKPEDLTPVNATLTYNDLRFATRDVYVRLEPLSDLETNDQFPEAEESYQKLELTFFNDPLTKEMRKRLEIVPSVLNDAFDRIGFRPAFQMIFFLPQSTVQCVSQNFNDARLVVPGPGGTTMSLTPKYFAAGLSQRAGGYFKIVCPQIRNGKTISLRYSEKPPGGQYAWEIKVDAPINEFRPLGRIHYDSFDHALAIWHPVSGQLKVGFYPIVLDQKQVSGIIRANSLTAMPEIQPDMIATIPLPPETSQASPNKVSQGYTLDIFTRENGNIKIPGGRDHLTITFDAGETPSTLTGKLESGKRLVGNIEGRWNKYFPDEGVLQFSCYVPFNAAVIVRE